MQFKLDGWSYMLPQTNSYCSSTLFTITDERYIPKFSDVHMQMMWESYTPDNINSIYLVVIRKLTGNVDLVARIDPWVKHDNQNINCWAHGCYIATD